MVELEFWQLLVLAGVVAGTQLLINAFRGNREIQRLKRQLTALEAKVTLLESAHLSSPLPMWMKDINFVVRSVNKAYENMFLKPRGYRDIDYLHHFDESVWPAEIAKEYRENDLMVLSTGKVYDTTETVVDHRGRPYQVRVIKFPRMINDIVIGIAGIAIPEPDKIS